MLKELTTEVVRGCLLYLDINWKIRWAYSSEITIITSLKKKTTPTSAP